MLNGFYFPSNALVFSLFGVLWVVVLKVRQRYARTYAPLPPGPDAGWFGLQGAPRAYDKPWLEFAKWREIYGDVCYIHAYGRPTIILNTSTATRELFEKRSHNYSSRVFRPMVNELMGWDWIFSSMPYGDRWRRHRRLFMRHFHPIASRQYLHIQIKETNILLHNLLLDPLQFAMHTRRSSAAITLKISYGYQVAPTNDRYVALADEALASLARAGLFGSFLVDYIPILKHVPSWFPGAGFKRDACKWKRLSLAMRDWPFDLTKRRMASVGGLASPSIAAIEVESLIHDSAGRYYDEEIVQNVAGISYAGAETTTSVILAFILAMVLHPEVQQKAQSEIDRIVGIKRLPCLSDREKMPYLNGVVYECLRWNPVLPLGLAHASMEDDIYDGMFIPANTMIYANTWAILHDADAYPQPDKFLPERYNKPQQPGINEYPIEAFGFGRRICPGRHLAEVTVWLAISNILACFNIKNATDETGNPIFPKEDFTSGLLSRPKPFLCSITPRSEDSVALIKEAQA